jgi:hypothetical protein
MVNGHQLNWTSHRRGLARAQNSY